MARSRGEVVLVTGYRGFLGQHVLKHLVKDKNISEIRGLDKLPYDEGSKPEVKSHDDSARLKIFQRDLIDIESCREVVRNVDVVIHAAALVAYDFPAPKELLHDNNVLATENLIRLCLEEGASRFIYCSTTEVFLQSYVRGGIVAVVIYSSESKVGAPSNADRLIFGEYAGSKLRAEKLVLDANGKAWANGKGVLHTLSLRPPLLYGDGDVGFIYRFLKVGKKRGNTLPRLAGKGGKQQLAYVGNVAWAFILAKNTLRYNPESIAGLPITITDDTPVMDVVQFCRKITKDSKNRVNASSWTIPTIISYALAWMLETVASLNLGWLKKLPISPRSLIAYMGSVILHDRTRASIHLNYDPVYPADEAMNLASSYYCKAMDDTQLRFQWPLRQPEVHGKRKN